ncbi:MAG: leucine-rich repeat domain-containing protein [Clostridia bacterium]
MKAKIKNGVLLGIRFDGKDNSSTFIMPNRVKYIDDHVFSGCSRLTGVTISNRVTSIDDEAFLGCTGLTSVTIPDSVTRIGDEAFYGCLSLKSVTIPGSVKSIGYEAFGTCISLTSVTIPDGVTRIGGAVFVGCLSLTSVTIPNSVTSIGYEIFAYTGNGLQVCFETGTNEINIDEKTFGSSKFKFVYLSKDGKRIVFSCYEDENLKNSSHEFDFEEGFLKLFNNNFRENLIKSKNCQKEKNIKYTSPEK